MSFSRTLGDGRINLEQQRKRAKEAVAPVAPRPGQPYRASGAGAAPGRRPVAGGARAGFASWPRLKAHVDAIAFASRHPDLVGGDEAATLHLRCGNDIAHGLKLAGFRGDFRMFADPLTMGPVPNLPLPEFLALRSDYLSRAFDLDPADAQARQRQEYAGLERLGEYSRVALWCEADAYDQLFLVRVLAGMQTPPEHLELIEIDRVPGVERFVGIGQLAPEPARLAMDSASPAGRRSPDAGPRGLGSLPRSGATALGATGRSADPGATVAGAGAASATA